MMGDKRPTTDRLPVVLFYGPPGAGKTHAMRLIAATRLKEPFEKAFKWSATKLLEDSYRGPRLFRTALDKIADLEGGIIFIDEAEPLIRRKVAEPSHLAATKRKEMQKTFQGWIQGLETKAFVAGGHH